MALVSRAALEQEAAALKKDADAKLARIAELEAKLAAKLNK